MTLTQLSSLNTLYEDFVVMLYHRYFTYGAELLNAMIESKESSQKGLLTKIGRNACEEHKEFIKQIKENIVLIRPYFKNYKDKLIKRIERSEDEQIHIFIDKRANDVSPYTASRYFIDVYLDLATDRVLLYEISMQVNLIEEVYK